MVLGLSLQWLHQPVIHAFMSIARQFYVLLLMFAIIFPVCEVLRCGDAPVLCGGATDDSCTPAEGNEEG